MTLLYILNVRSNEDETDVFVFSNSVMNMFLTSFELLWTPNYFGQPWHSMKYRIHITSASLSANEISSVSVELFVLHFIMLDELETAPCPKVTRLPVWPRQSS